MTSALAREFLPAYPTPAALTALTERQWQRWARAHGLSAARAGDLWALLRQPHLPVPAHVVRAKARLMRTLMEQLLPVVAAVAQYRKAIDDFFASMPAAQWARTLPIGKHGITTPTLCLPLIRPIGSRRPPQVFVMESTYAWHCHHPALARWLHAPRLGCVFSQG